MSDSHWEREREIFERFAAVTKLPIVPSSIRRGDGYDVTWLTSDGERLAFELSEIVDKPWAAEVSGMTVATTLLNRQLHAENNDSAAVRQGYRGHDIMVTLVPKAGTRRLRPALEGLFAWMATLSPAEVAGAVPPAALRAIVERVVARDIGVPEYLYMYAAGRAVWIGDQTVATIARKFGKDYPRNIGLQLLAYFYTQPAPPDSAANARAYLEVEMCDDMFSRVWVYSVHHERVVLRFP